MVKRATLKLKVNIDKNIIIYWREKLLACFELLFGGEREEAWG